MTEHINEGDTIRGHRLVYVARKMSNARLISKSGAHRGIQGKLYDAKCWIETPIEIAKR